MNIWLLPSAFAPHKGGVEEATLQIARNLRERGHDVLVITIRHPLTLPVAESIEGVPVVRYVFPSPRAALGPALLFPTAFVSSVIRLLRRTPRPDIIHVQCASVQLGPACAVAKLLRVPLVLTTQGEIEMDANDIYGHSVYLRTLFRVAAARAEACTACSHFAAERAARLATGFRDATVIPNGVDPAQWIVTPPSDDAVVAAWGRHVREKGFDLLLDAWPLVRERLPEARLLIGGSGTETRSLYSAAGEGVEFLGPLDRAAVQRLLDRCRVAVVPSRIEPFGIVALEAMATGRSVVWSCRGGLKEATGGLGWAVDPTDRVALAQVLVTALRSRPEPQRYRRRAEELSWTAITGQYLEVYERVCQVDRIRHI